MAQDDIFFLAVKAIIKNKEGKILLLKRNHILEGQPDSPWGFPGGKIQQHEAPQQALKREVFEETGLNIIKINSLVGTLLTPLRIEHQEKTAGFIIFCYTCEVDQAKNIILSDEHNSFTWLTPQEVIDHISGTYIEDTFLEKLRTI